MPQYNNQYTYEALQKLKLAVIPNTLDKREGSVIWNTLSANSYALSIAFMQMGINQNNMFPDTASRKFLIRHCAQRGIVPKEATYAKIKGEFFTSVVTGSHFNPDIGTRFTVENSSLIYNVTTQLEDGIFELTCETHGTVGNIVSGTLIPIEEIQSLGSAIILGIIDAGEDEEDTESLRERYMESLEAQSFAGNKAAYREMTKSIENVGACKVYRAYNGVGGQVGLCILNAQLDVPDEELVKTVQSIIDPDMNGEGTGYAPIDHIVTVFAASEFPVDVNLKITPVHTTTTWDSIKQSVAEVVEEYFVELKDTWDSTDKLIIRPSQLIAKLLSLDVILDVTQCTINGSTTNVQLSENQIPEVGEVSGEVV